MSEAAFSTSGLQLEADRGIWVMGLRLLPAGGTLLEVYAILAIQHA